MKTRSKIAIISPCYPLRGGIAEFTNNLAKHLIIKDDVMVFSYKLLYPKLLFPGKTQYETEERTMDFSYEPLLNSINPFTWLKVIKIINKEYDKVIIVYWTIFLSPALWLISKFIKIHKIGLFHNFMDHGMSFKPIFLLHNMDKIISLSEDVGRKIKRHTNKPLIICKHPIYDYGPRVSKLYAREILGLKDVKNVVLFFGLIKEYKGLDLLIKAVSKCKDVTLLVAGEFYHDSDIYLKEINTYKISERVIIHDKFIPHEMVKYYFCATDLVVLPYKSASQSGVIQISYSFNKPLLVTNVGGLPEFVMDNKTGYIAEPTEESIRYFINKYFTEKNESVFSENLSNAKEQYSWDFIVSNIVN